MFFFLQIREALKHLHHDVVRLLEHERVQHESLRRLTETLERIMVKQTEVAQELRTMKADNDQFREEVRAKFARLEAALPGDASEELVAATDDLKASIEADRTLGQDSPPVDPPV